MSLRPRAAAPASVGGTAKPKTRLEEVLWAGLLEKKNRTEDTDVAPVIPLNPDSLMQLLNTGPYDYTPPALFTQGPGVSNDDRRGEPPVTRDTVTAQPDQPGDEFVQYKTDADSWVTYRVSERGVPLPVSVRGGGSTPTLNKYKDDPSVNGMQAFFEDVQRHATIEFDRVPSVMGFTQQVYPSKVVYSNGDVIKIQWNRLTGSAQIARAEIGIDHLNTMLSFVGDPSAQAFLEATNVQDPRIKTAEVAAAIAWRQNDATRRRPSEDIFGFVKQKTIARPVQQMIVLMHEIKATRPDEWKRIASEGPEAFVSNVKVGIVSDGDVEEAPTSTLYEMWRDLEDSLKHPKYKTQLSYILDDGSIIGASFYDGQKWLGDGYTITVMDANGKTSESRSYVKDAKYSEKTLSGYVTQTLSEYVQATAGPNKFQPRPDDPYEVGRYWDNALWDCWKDFYPTEAAMRTGLDKIFQPLLSLGFILGFGFLYLVIAGFGIFAVTMLGLVVIEPVREILSGEYSARAEAARIEYQQRASQREANDAQREANNARDTRRRELERLEEEERARERARLQVQREFEEGAVVWRNPGRAARSPARRR